MNQPDSTDTATILVVEDEPHLRAILAMTLEGVGYAVRSAEDGVRGLEEVRREPPDLILLDVMMPGMDGFEVCRQLKDNPVTSRIPVIFLTAKNDDKDRIHGLEVFADDYIIKPWDTKELLFRVRNQLRTRRAQLQSNPLTGLPGNVLIETELARRIAAGEKFAFLLIDLDRFKSYNDYYGYARGDAVIRSLASLLHEELRRHGGAGDFVGHIGGDDFVVITAPGRATAIANAIQRGFDTRSGGYYDPADRDRGHITVISSRQGGVTRFDLMTITILVVTNLYREITHSAQVSDIAKELKQKGKAMKGSVVLYDRRMTDTPAVGSPGGTKDPPSP